MFLKIKGYNINLGRVRYTQINTEKKSIRFIFCDQECLKFSLSNDPDDLNTIEYDQLINFLYSGEYEGCSESITILKPLKKEI